MPWVYFSYGPFGPAKVQGRFDVIIVTNYLSGRLDLINTDVVLFSYHSFITFNIEKYQMFSTYTRRLNHHLVDT